MSARKMTRSVCSQVAKNKGGERRAGASEQRERERRKQKVRKHRRVQCLRTSTCFAQSNCVILKFIYNYTYKVVLVNIVDKLAP